MKNEAPGLDRGAYSPGIPPLFHSRREIALIKDKSFKAGFGYVKAGQIVGVTLDDFVVPYGVTVPLVANAANASSVVVVSEADAARFAVGDTLAVSEDSTVDDLGAVISIVVAGGQATITVDGTVGSADFTTANNAAVFHKTSATTPFVAAGCILDKDINTGTEAGLSEVPVSVVFGNCMLYKVFVTGIDAAALTALNAIEDGRHLIVK